MKGPFKEMMKIIYSHNAIFFEKKCFALSFAIFSHIYNLGVAFCQFYIVSMVFYKSFAKLY